MPVTTTNTLIGMEETWFRASRPTSLYATAEWLGCNESGTDSSTLRYVLGTDTPGSMVVRKIGAGGFLGGDPLWCLFHPGGDEAVTTEQSALAAATGDLFPLAAASLPGSYLPGLLGGEAVPDWKPFLAALEETARDWSCPTTAVLNVPDGHPAAAFLGEHGFVAVPSFAQAVMTVEGESLEDYVARFHRRGRVRRARVVREIRSFEQAGMSVRETGLDEFDVPHAALHLRQLSRYGHDFSAEWLVELMRRSAHHLGQWARMTVAERDGVPEAFTVCYSYGGELHVKMSGFSEYAERNSAYFFMIFYEMIAYAQRVGTKRIEYGPLTYEAKVGRGCALEPRTNYIRFPEPWREDFSVAAAAADRESRNILAGIEKSWNSMM